MTPQDALIALRDALEHRAEVAKRQSRAVMRGTERHTRLLGHVGAFTIAAHEVTRHMRMIDTTTEGS